MAGRASANIIIPGKLAQRGNFMTWSRRQKERLLTELGTTVIVNMWAKTDSDLSWEEDRDRFYIQWHTSPSEVPANADAMVAFVAGLMRAGHVVLVHCEAGRGRSVWFSSRLLAEYANIPRAEAFALVKAAVTNYDVTPTLEDDLR